MAAKLSEMMVSGQTLSFNWACNFCSETHTGNLLKKAKMLNIDHLSGEQKADIALLNNEGKLLVAIHILKNKKPVEEKIEHYTKQDVIYIQLRQIDTSEKTIDEIITNPVFVGTCFNPKCEACNHYQKKNELVIIDAPCWKCHQNMKIAVLRAGMSRGGTTVGPKSFTPEEISFAQKMGVIIQPHYSRTVSETYLASTCSSCGTFAGEFKLFVEYYHPAQMGDYPFESYDIGYHCEYCDMMVSTEKESD